jgi:hypothetical protein
VVPGAGVRTMHDGRRPYAPVVLLLGMGALARGVAGVTAVGLRSPWPAAHDVGPAAASPPEASTDLLQTVIPGGTSFTPGGTLALEAAPAAGELGPPSWIKPGTRLTFYSAAASVEQSGFGWVEAQR